MNRSRTVDRRTALQAALGMAGFTPFIGRAAEQAQPAPRAAAPANPVVETTIGKIRGFTSRGVAVFRGIPYGASTTGANRFLPPVKPDPWPGVRNCLSYGHSCPEPGPGVVENDSGARNTDEDAFLLYRTNGWIRGEDCLRLNVWTPSTRTSARKRPVMVYMHGGGYTGGSGNDLLCYDGENMARFHDVVVVTHNHRLNLFGYLSLAEIGGERYASSGNVGMLDIVAVLEWVRDNIASFGGDPANVLIYGQSGGGGKVSTLMAMPAAKGLFHRAVVQSGSNLRSGSAENAARMAAAVLDELGISKSQLDKIHELPASALQAVQPAAQRRLRGPGAPSGPAPGGLGGWGPILDGKVIPAHPFDPAAPAVSAGVPMLIGTCLNPHRGRADEARNRTVQREGGRHRGRLSQGVSQGVALRNMGGHLGRHAAPERRHAGRAQSRPGRRSGIYVHVRLAHPHARRPHRHFPQQRDHIRIRQRHPLPALFGRRPRGAGVVFQDGRSLGQLRARRQTRTQRPSALARLRRENPRHHAIRQPQRGAQRSRRYRPAAHPAGGIAAVI